MFCMINIYSLKLFVWEIKVGYRGGSKGVVSARVIFQHRLLLSCPHVLGLREERRRRRKRRTSCVEHETRRKEQHVWRGRAHPGCQQVLFPQKKKRKRKWEIIVAFWGKTQIDLIGANIFGGGSFLFLGDERERLIYFRRRRGGTTARAKTEENRARFWPSRNLFLTFFWENAGSSGTRMIIIISPLHFPNLNSASHANPFSHHHKTEKRESKNKRGGHFTATPIFSANDFPNCSGNEKKVSQQE